MTSVVLLLASLAVGSADPAAAGPLPVEVSESLRRALDVPRARVVVRSWSQPPGCSVRRASVPHAILSSGRVAVKIAGPGCAGWGWARVEVWAETAITTRALRTGEALTDAFELSVQEIRSGRMPFVPPSTAVAARVLPAGAMLDEADVSIAGKGVGESVSIVFVSGTVAVEANGKRTTCTRGRGCAVLASGRHVEGRWGDRGELIVEVPR